MLPLKYFRSENVVFEENVQEAGIFVDENGKISKIVVGDALKNVQLEENIQVYDVGKLVIMAGLVDSHVHVNEPGRTAWEGYETATKAAAAGGITTIVDMPLNSMPPTTTVDNFKTKINATQNKIHVDVAFWGGVVPGNENELQPLIKAGVVGFKCFLCNTGIDDFTHVNAEQVKIALEKLSTTSSVLAFHAEMDEDVTSDGDPKKYNTFLKSRPPTMEINAIKLVASLCEKYKVRCHIVHLSAADALPIIREIKNKTDKLTVETCHHYLWFDAENIPDEGTQYKCTPPIRSSSNRETLWQALKNDDIDLVVSDHSPCTPDLKYLLKSDNKTEGDFLKAWGGISSVQFGLSLFWTQARQRSFEIYSLTKYLSKRPAELCGLSNLKGEIAVGKDADFVIWDPHSKFKINENIIHHKNKVTPYIGKQLYGKVFYTVLRGNIIYEIDKDFKKPQGKLLIPGV